MGAAKGDAMVTFSVIKADTGGFVGHSAVHPRMIEVAGEMVDSQRGRLLRDGQVNSCGDDLALILVHDQGIDADVIHSFAWDVFRATTGIAKEYGLYGAGQDILSDAFSGNLRGMGPGF